VRAGSLLPTHALRVDLYPTHLQHPRHMLALEWVLARNGSSRTAVTYEQLAGARAAPAQGSTPPPAPADGDDPPLVLPGRVADISPAAPQPRP